MLHVKILSSQHIMGECSIPSHFFKLYNPTHENINHYFILQHVLFPSSFLSFFLFPSTYAMFHTFISESDCTPLQFFSKYVYNETSNYPSFSQKSVHTAHIVVALDRSEVSNLAPFRPNEADNRLFLNHGLSIRYDIKTPK
jgi:hypothetical protein